MAPGVTRTPTPTPELSQQPQKLIQKEEAEDWGKVWRGGAEKVNMSGCEYPSARGAGQLAVFSVRLARAGDRYQSHGGATRARADTHRTTHIYTMYKHSAGRQHFTKRAT
ncbi:hypothetical protein RRG08_037067 [Elysia crispata]|uniref:Uncharacterized protein n=1 Tax=Elysia crispata TaxID=231223 RepID=A0AAE0ZX61_9GAST|nr:hypothetical protein RRG08_037067 [Elysia crispata]